MKSTEGKWTLLLQPVTDVKVPVCGVRGDNPVFNRT